MATAVKTAEKIKKLMEVEQEVGHVQLTLSLEEARTLEIILGRIGGCPSHSRRHHADDILYALRDVGPQERDDDDEKFLDNERRSIYFKTTL